MPRYQGAFTTIPGANGEELSAEGLMASIQVQIERLRRLMRERCVDVADKAEAAFAAANAANTAASKAMEAASAATVAATQASHAAESFTRTANTLSHVSPSPAGAPAPAPVLPPLASDTAAPPATAATPAPLPTATVTPAPLPLATRVKSTASALAALRKQRSRGFRVDRSFFGLEDGQLVHGLFMPSAFTARMVADDGVYCLQHALDGLDGTGTARRAVNWIERSLTREHRDNELWRGIEMKLISASKWAYYCDFMTLLGVIALLPQSFRSNIMRRPLQEIFDIAQGHTLAASRENYMRFLIRANPFRTYEKFSEPSKLPPFTRAPPLCRRPAGYIATPDGLTVPAMADGECEMDVRTINPTAAGKGRAQKRKARSAAQAAKRSRSEGGSEGAAASEGGSEGGSEGNSNQSASDTPAAEH